jgi:hypothetical protein
MSSSPSSSSSSSSSSSPSPALKESGTAPPLPPPAAPPGQGASAKVATKTATRKKGVSAKKASTKKKTPGKPKKAASAKKASKKKPAAKKASKKKKTPASKAITAPSQPHNAPVPSNTSSRKGICIGVGDNHPGERRSKDMLEERIARAMVDVLCFGYHDTVQETLDPSSDWKTRVCINPDCKDQGRELWERGARGAGKILCPFIGTKGGRGVDGCGAKLVALQDIVDAASDRGNLSSESEAVTMARHKMLLTEHDEVVKEADRLFSLFLSLPAPLVC